MKTKLLLYGMQRSGTNFIETLLKKNFKVKFLNNNKDRSSASQKHARLYDEKAFIPEPQYYNDIHVKNINEFEKLLEVNASYYLVISKDPYSWYLSYKAWAKKCNWGKVNHHYIEEYHLFYRKFLDLATESNRFIFIKYLDLIHNQELELESLANKMNLQKRLKSKLFNPKTKKVAQSKNFSNKKLEYYLNADFLEKYSAEELKKINNKLDLKTVEELGYRIYN